MKNLSPALIRKDFPLLSKEKPPIYFDSAASCLTPNPVIEQLKNFYSSCPVNIHRGTYPLSDEATKLYENTRDKVQSFLNAQDREEIIFVRGATEGINLVASSFGEHFLKEGDEVLVSQMEHHSNFIPWQILQQKKKIQLKIIPLNQEGGLCKEHFQKLLTSKTRLVALTHCSHVLGTYNDLLDFTKMTHEVGGYILIDGAQAVPHFPINVRKLDCDFYVFSAHKIFGPFGAGVLFGKKNLLQEMPPYQTGGGMIEQVSNDISTYQALPSLRFEAGTPSIADVVGLGAALDYLGQWSWKAIQSYEQELLSYATKQLESHFHPSLIFYGPPKC